MSNLQITTCQVTRIALPAIDLHQSHIPQCTTFVMDVCTFLLQSDSLWDICPMHCGICAMDLWHQDDMPHYPSMKVTMFLGGPLQMVPQHAGTWTQPQHRRPYNVLGGLENRQMFNSLTPGRFSRNFHTNAINLRMGYFSWNSRVTFKLARWPWKTIGHLFYATSSFVHHLVPIGEFKLELQSGNSEFGSSSTSFRAVRPWNLTDDLAKQ